MITIFGYTLVENRILKKDEAVLLKASNTVMVGNILPLLFSGVGKYYTLEQALDLAFNNAQKFIFTCIDNKTINLKITTNETSKI